MKTTPIAGGDIWQTRDLNKIIGCQQRAGKPAQINPQPGTITRFDGWRARLSRLLRQLIGDGT